MSTRNLRRNFLALVAITALILLPTISQAAPYAAPRLDGPGARIGVASLFSWAWSLLQNVWGTEGASLDPNGLRSTSAPEGGSLDPNGLTGPGDEGGSLDPDGLRSPGDEGGSLDPNG